MYYFFYSNLMKLDHRFNWHYAPPSYPDGDTVLWCQWCGLRGKVMSALESTQLVREILKDFPADENVHDIHAELDKFDELERSKHSDE